MGRYSWWFRQAYPNRKERQLFIRSLIEGKPVTPATMRLAHLLAESKIATVVLTPNFDELLSQALELFGLDHVTSDHPRTAVRIDPVADDLQLVHVHGSYWHYDACNLDDEIETRAGSAMANLLDATLRARTPIVIGYSGWEQDVLMQALLRRLGPTDDHQALPFGLFWFVRRASQVDSMPTWLSSHPDVVFVTPPEQEPDPPPVVEPGDNRARLHELAESREAEHILDASDAIDALLAELDVPSPLLTRNPLEFLDLRLRHRISSDVSTSSNPDPYSLQGVLERIARLRALESAAKPDPLESKVAAIEDAVRSADYMRVSSLTSRIAVEELSAAQLDRFASVVAAAIDGLVPRAPEVGALLERQLRAENELAKREPGSDAQAVRRIRAAARLGRRYLERGRAADAARIVAGIADDLGDHPGQDRLEAVIESLLVYSRALLRSRQIERAENAARQAARLVKTFTGKSHADLTARVALALSAVLQRKREVTEARGVLEGAIGNLGPTDDPIVASSGGNVLMALGRLEAESGDHARAAEVFERVAAYYHQVEDRLVRKAVYDALVAASFAYGEAGDIAASQEVLDRLVALASRRRDGLARAAVVTAFAHKAAALHEAGESSRAIPEADAAIDLGHRDNYRPAKSEALYAYTVKADALEKTGDLDAALTTLEQMQHDLTRDKRPQRFYAGQAQIHRANVLRRMGDLEGAEAALQNVLDLPVAGRWERDANQVEARFKLAYLKHEAGEIDEAIRRYKTVADSPLTRNELWGVASRVQLGLALASQAETDAAIATLSPAVRQLDRIRDENLKGELLHGVMHLIEILNKAGRPAEARRIGRTIVRSHRDQKGRNANLIERIARLIDVKVEDEPAALGEDRRPGDVKEAR
jgi:tetratricopeptide (TPR) repeat protein